MTAKAARTATRAALWVPSALVVAVLAFVAALFVEVPWEPEFVYKLERNTTHLPQSNDINESDYRRSTLHFTSQGEQLEAWFYEPVPSNPAAPPPVVIMCHGLGAQKDMGLHGYAEQFAQGGMAVLVFDYRGFGGSDGAVRHWISWKRHVQDLQSALDFVVRGGLGADRVDATRVALWGVSYSGAHSLTVASREHNWPVIKAVVANEPYLSGDGNIGKAIKERGIARVLRLLLATLLDKGRELTGQPPLYVKLVGGFHEIALLSLSPKELELSRSHSPGQNPPARIGGWKNLATARMLIDHLSYKPMEIVHLVRAPVLMVLGSKDEITRPEHIREAARLLGDRVQLMERPYGHIEMHRKMVDPQELAPVVDFLRQHLGLVPPEHVRTQPHEAHVEDESPEVL